MAEGPPPDPPDCLVLRPAMAVNALPGADAGISDLVANGRVAAVRPILPRR